MLHKETIDLRRIDTALIGGDFSGNARGAYAIDVQTGKTEDRGGPILTQVASGDNAATYGFANEASGTNSLAIGFNNLASGLNAVANGFTTVASGDNSTVIGNNAIASGEKATALGYVARTRLAQTVNIGGLLIIQKDTGGLSEIENFSGAEAIILSEEVDLKLVEDQTITLPAGSKFWWNECGLLATDITVDAGNQPTIRFGITGNLDKQVAAAITTDLTAVGKREIETPLVPEDGETSLTAGVTIASTYVTCKGRFYWKGMFVEDE